MSSPEEKSEIGRRWVIYETSGEAAMIQTEAHRITRRNLKAAFTAGFQAGVEAMENLNDWRIVDEK